LLNGKFSFSTPKSLERMVLGNDSNCTRQMPELVQTTESHFRSDIQAMRALAVLLVVSYHFGIPGVHGGYLGVDVFFVISGYVITMALLREREATGATSIPGFYARRIRRILPAASAVLIATVFATYHWLSFISGRINAIDARYVAGFIGNFRFSNVGTQYFNAVLPPSTLQQFWSLAVEEQFYLVWPVLFWVLTKPVQKPSQTGRLVGTLSLVIVGSLAWCVIQTRVDAGVAFFSPFARAWELATGGLLAVLSSRMANRSINGGRVLSLAGVAMVTASAWFYSSSTQWPGVAVVLPVAGAALMIAGGTLRGSKEAGRIINSAPVQWVGNISYSLYLVHWPVIAIATQYALKPLSLKNRLELLGLSFIMASLLFYVVENPIRKSKWLLRRKGVTLIFGATLIGLSLALITWHLSHF
jgi:peptidoglycan/LPS O-acetylase OafA/YrhL